MMRWSFLAIAMLIGSTFCRAEDVCDRGKQVQDSARVAEQQRQLRAIPITGDDLSGGIPDKAQRLIQQFKAALIESARGVIACHGTSSTPASVQADFTQALHANAPQPPPGSSISNGDTRYTEALSFAYGSNLLFKVARPSANLLRIDISFQIECGNDNILMLFEAQGSHWNERIAWQSRPYKEIYGAFGGGFQIGILPGAISGAWRAVVLHTYNQCASRWYEFALDVLAPSESPEHPRVVAHLDHGFLLDHDLSLKTKGDSFTIRLFDSAMDADVMERPYILHYELHGDALERVQPIATNGRYFVEEWLELPWTEAVRFSDPTSATALKQAHQRIAPRTAGRGVPEFDGYGPVRACLDNPKHFQVEFDNDSFTDSPRRRYFQIVEHGNGYTMMIANSNTPDPQCQGPNIMRADAGYR